MSLPSATFSLHAYFGIDWEIVWRAANHEAPLLSARISRIVDTEYPGQR